MYTPKDKELIEMGFIPWTWEGTIYRWDYGGLSYKPKDNAGLGIDPDDEECWSIGSWWCKINPQNRQDVENIIKIIIKDKQEKKT